MNNEQKKALEDIKAFIGFAIENDMPFFSILGNIGHDVSGLLNEDDTFLPRTHGYAKRCKRCGELLNGEVRVHHHTDSRTGEDITQ